MAGIGVSAEWLEEHGFKRDGMLNNYFHEASGVWYNTDRGTTWAEDYMESVELYPKSGKELLLCVKLRTEDRP